MSWESELKGSLKKRGQLPKDFLLTPDEEAWFTHSGRTDGVPFSVTPLFFSRAAGGGKDPVRRQFIPTIAEFDKKPYETADPLWEASFSPVPRLIHRYRNRVLVLVTDQCAVYCRHCFRRHFSGKASGILSPEETEKIALYIQDHEEVREIILSGGDPLLLSDSRLSELLKKLLPGREVLFRLATRTPVVLPERINENFIAAVAPFPNLVVVTQFNHPREIGRENRRALNMLIDNGIPVLNQTVLLKGINDDADILEELFTRLTFLKVHPYYLFQGDLAEGTAHFRTTIDDGLSLMRTLKERLSGLSLPVYALDLPGGGGKVRLDDTSIKRREKGGCILEDGTGKEYWYPD